MRWWTNVEVRTLREMWDLGHPKPAIAKKLNRSTQAIGQKSRHLKLPERPFVGRPPVWTEARRNLLSRRRADGVSLLKISVELRLSLSAVKAACKRYDIPAVIPEYYYREFACTPTAISVSF
jgi:hypothetical protein